MSNQLLECSTWITLASGTSQKLISAYISKRCTPETIILHSSSWDMGSMHVCLNLFLIFRQEGLKLATKILRELACMSREAPCFCLEPESFSITAAYFFVFTVWGCDRFFLRTICWCHPPQKRWPKIAVKGSYLSS